MPKFVSPDFEVSTSKLIKHSSHYLTHIWLFPSVTTDHWPPMFVELPLLYTTSPAAKQWISTFFKFSHPLRHSLTDDGTDPVANNVTHSWTFFHPSFFGSDQFHKCTTHVTIYQFLTRSTQQWLKVIKDNSRFTRSTEVPVHIVLLDLLHLSLAAHSYTRFSRFKSRCI